MDKPNPPPNEMNGSKKDLDHKSLNEKNQEMKKMFLDNVAENRPLVIGNAKPEIVIDKKLLKSVQNQGDKKSDRLTISDNGSQGKGKANDASRVKSSGDVKEPLVEKKNISETKTDHLKKRGIVETGNLIKSNGSNGKQNVASFTKSNQNFSLKLPTGSKLTSPSLYSLHPTDVFSTNQNGVSQSYSTTEVNRIILAGNKNMKEANFANKSLASIAMGSTDGKKLFIRRVPTSPSELLNLNNNGQPPHIT